MAGSYNLSGSGNVRIGNWFEEQRLELETGIRFSPDPKDRTTSLMTKARCIVHTEQTLAKDYISTMTVEIIDPKTHPTYLPPSSTVGPRYLAMEKRLKKEIAADFKQKELDAFNETRVTDYSSK
jgi:hypothetical protein